MILNLFYAWTVLASTTAARALSNFPNLGEFITLASQLGLSNATISELGALLPRSCSPGVAATLSEITCLAASKLDWNATVDLVPLDDAVVSQHWSQACVAEPTCVVTPREASDVSAMLRIIRLFRTKFAVRSGGHSPNPGWSSVAEPGILIDLQLLNSIELADDGATASVGPGARWGEVYEALDPYQAVVVGGRIPDVGVGGLVLGGGYFHLSGLHGLAADNVKNFEVVLSGGQIVDANAAENSQLFWALKGGGPNFGIVTRYDLYTIPNYIVWGQISIFAPSQALELIEAFDRWQEDGAADSKSTVALAIGLDAITLGLTYSEPQASIPSVFGPFLGIEPLFVAVPSANLTFDAVNKIMGADGPMPPGRDYRGISTRINTALTQDIYRFWLEEATAVRASTGATQTFAIQHVGPNLIEQGNLKGGSPLNIARGPQQWWTTLVDWQDEADDALVRSVSINTAELWDKLAKERGLDLSFIFMNDASRDQNPLGSYGNESLTRLKQISLEFDKDQVFQRQQNGGFLLART